MPAPRTAVVLRPAVEADRDAVWSLVAHMSHTPYAELLAYFLPRAFEANSHETRAIVAKGDGAVAGFVLFGEVAGAIGTGRVHFVAVNATVRRRAIGSSLCDAAVADFASQGVRLVVSEVPDDETSAAGRALLTCCGFVEVGRVPAYYRDAVDLLLLQREITR